MKFRLLLIPFILFMLFIPIVGRAENCDLDKIKIQSVSIKDKSNSVIEVEPPKIDEKNIKVNLKMTSVGDSIEYTLLLKNDSNEDYEIDENSFQSNSGYIEYSIDSSNNSTVIKAGEEKKVYLKVQYKTAIPDSEFNGEVYNSNENLALNLSNVQVLDNIVNPQTSYRVFLLLLAIILCFSAILFLMFYKKKNNTLMIFILGIVSILPISVFALCKVQININSSVSIERGFRVDYLIGEYVLYTDSELAKYEKTRDTMCNILFVGEEKYNYCSNIIIKDDTLHKEGTSVELNAMKVKVPGLNYIEGCERREDGSLMCSPDTPIEDFVLEKWHYNEEDISNNGYVFDSNDKQIMNFSEYNNTIYINDIFEVNAPQSFTMPGHHILFSYYATGDSV